MKLTEIKESKELFLTPADIAEVLQTNPQLIRITAREAPQLLGFPVVVVGTRTKIPRRPFLAFLGEEESE